MLQLLIAIIIIALVAYIVSLLLGQPAGLITFVVLLLLILLGTSSSHGLHPR